ncbi:MAG: SET domain-containing protein [archaeon]
MNGKKIALEMIKKTYCRLKPSLLGGVGIFAIDDIPKGINPFASAPKPKWIRLNARDLAGLDKERKRLVDDFYVKQKDGTIWVNKTGFYGMDMSFYINHSKNPNMVEKKGGDYFVTKRKIKKGEELIVDYGTYDSEWK